MGRKDLRRATRPGRSQRFRHLSATFVPPALPSANGSADVHYYFSNQVQIKLEAIGLESTTWTYKYNSGRTRLGRDPAHEKATHSAFHEILATAYDLT
jgi:hypothetical protein